MSTLLNTTSPLSYQDWSNQQGAYADLSQQNYLNYLNSWYSFNNKLKSSAIPSTREQYIQLVKDLIFLFNSDERDQFLSQIDYDNNEDLIYVIPYLAHKLKEITQVISQKREEIKKAKTKHTLIGSNIGLESILYQYVLSNFTNKQYSYTRIPVSPLANYYPQLSSVNSDFFVEIEELYDSNNYFDSDPSIPISEYVDLNAAATSQEFSNLTTDELNAIAACRMLGRVAPTPLSKVFNQYLTTIPILSTTSLSGFYTSQINNLVAASQKYLGESIYALTAIKTSDLNAADFTLNLNFQTGNNWFYWPSGDKIVNDQQIGNIFTPISINNSNLLINRATSGTTYKDSDLIFTEKNGIIQGAWLQGTRIEYQTDNLQAKFNSKEKTSFIFPYVWFTIDSKTLNFNGYSLSDSDKHLYETLEPQVRKNLLTQYYTSTPPNSASFDLYLNQTSLIEGGSYAAKFSDEADTIVKRTNNSSINSMYTDYVLLPQEEAFLYKFDTTDLVVDNGSNDIIWPYTVLPSFSNLPITIKQDTCLPVRLSEIEPEVSMIGAIAGNTFDLADRIYKYSDKTQSVVLEAAWLASTTTDSLDFMANSIPIYSSPAVNCSEYLVGPLQTSLSFNLNSGSYVSFIWMDADTPADQVFKYHEHASNCPYFKSFPHNYYTDQDYQNPNPLNTNLKFPLEQYPCTCRSIYYSPLGNQASTIDGYNGVADYLFADPSGLGSNFTLGNWYDTRNLDVYNSPQFSFFRLDGSYDKDIGYGTGSWQTGNGSQMILKTGRRYTYFRNPLKNTINANSTVPYLLLNYPYKNITLTNSLSSPNVVDLVVLIDSSRSETIDLGKVKQVVLNLCSATLSQDINTKISIVSFAEEANVLTYLTSDIGSITNAINSISVPLNYPDFTTNIYQALLLAQNILTTTYPEGNNCDINNSTALCSNLEFNLLNAAQIATQTNCPRPISSKSILIFSDGLENDDAGIAVPYAELLKNIGFKIISMDVGVHAEENNNMELLASNGQYFNLQRYLGNSDGNLNNFVQYTASKLVNNFPNIPRWCKAVKMNDGTWIGTSMQSDLVLLPGDYVSYYHQGQVTFTGAQNGSFSIPSLSFPVNIKLNGWDYNTNTFSLTSIGSNCGAKPFWGKVYTDEDMPNNFFKGNMSFGGQVRIVSGYVPVFQPEISQMVLKNSSYMEYISRGDSDVFWHQPLLFEVTLNNTQWNKITINKEFSNLAFAMNDANIMDLVVDSSYEPSDIVLESYNSFKPALYNYYARSPFTYTENLYYINSCATTLVSLMTGKVLDAVNASSNLTNVHNPTIANVAFASEMVSQKQTGGFITPDKFGVSYYRGKGYEINITADSLSYSDSLSAERLFLDSAKYGPRNRGLTKKDQISPVEIQNINNTWLMNSYGSGNLAGVISDSVDNQKLVPYQTNYEIYNENNLGVSLQSDDFQFWNPDNLTWTDEVNYPLTLRKEVMINSYNQRVSALLTDSGDMNAWRTDVFGNNYGLFK